MKHFLTLLLCFPVIASAQLIESPAAPPPSASQLAAESIIDSINAEIKHRVAVHRIAFETLWKNTREWVLHHDGTEKARVSSSGFTIGAAGTPVSSVISATATLDFDLTSVIVQDLTMTVTGAAVGDVVSIGVPHGSVTATAQYTAWVSATNTVTVRCRTAVAGENPASGTFRATIIKH